jgi:radical SAM superfamily enzyme YgiQ (UPF0313 family)
MPFEQGPIRPPSESESLLVRVSRNCPWNRCAFCPVYKGERFSLRTPDEVIGELDEMLLLVGDRVRTVFLQDANPLLTPGEDLLRILEAIRRRFPRVERVTAYARSHTLAHRSLEELRRLRAAGLDRLHVGLESGSDRVLLLMRKGVTREQQIAGGTRAREAGFEVSEYVMPGLGGKALSQEHAEETASALREIRPHFVRLRTTLVAPGTPLAEMTAQGSFAPLTEVEVVEEIRCLVVALGAVETSLVSDHVMNLLMGLRGDLPAQREAVLQRIDRFLGLPEEEKGEFIRRRRIFGMRLL